MSHISDTGRPAYRTIIRLPAFERSARGLLSADDEAWLDQSLAQRPAAGAVVPGTGGVRKLRVALPGRGKRGGARIIYYYRAAVARVYLIVAYAKNTRVTLSGAEQRRIRKLVSELESEP